MKRYAALLAALGLSVTACQRKETSEFVPPFATNLVAEVGGNPISVEAFTAELQRRFPNASGDSLTPTQKESVLESLIRREALYASALKVGFDQTSEMQARIKALVVAQYQEQQFALPDIAVTETEVETAYRTQEQRFARPAAARGAMIFIACPATAVPEKRTEMRSRAEAVGEEARQAATPEAFAKVVVLHSDHQPSRYRGGDTGWTTSQADGLDAPVRDALLTLHTPGEFTPLLETSRGFYVVKLLERREAGQQPLNEIWELLRHELARQKAQDAERAFFARMKSGLDIRIHQERLKSIQLPTRETRPPSLPGANTAQTKPESSP